MIPLWELIVGGLFIGITYVPGRVFGRPLHRRSIWILRLTGAAIITIALCGMFAQHAGSARIDPSVSPG